MFMKMQGKGPLGCSDEVRAVTVSENGVTGVKQPFNIADWKSDFNPILRTAVLEPTAVNSTIIEPFMHLIECFIGRLHKLIHLLC
jgi:hypothetical protein